jgi:hypothetical protein
MVCHAFECMEEPLPRPPRARPTSMLRTPGPTMRGWQRVGIRAGVPTIPCGSDRIRWRNARSGSRGMRNARTFGPID